MGAWPAVCVLVAIVGCDSSEPVRSYRVPKPEAVFAANHVEEHAKPDGESRKGEPTRMVAAILPQTSETWFFKLQGPPEEVAKVEGAVKDFYRSIEFDLAGQAKWTLPKGWSERAGGSEFRFATIDLGKSGLSLSVTKFGNPGEDSEHYVLINVDRWRGQVGLPKLSAASKLTPENGVTREKRDWGTSWLVDITGTSGGGAPMSAPFAGGRRNQEPAEPPRLVPARMIAAIMPRKRETWFFKMTGREAAVNAVADTTEEFLRSVTFDDADTPEWELPSGWKEAPAGNRFRYATILVGDDGLELSVSKLANPQADPEQYLLLNVDRWRGQLGLRTLGRTEALTEENGVTRVERDGSSRVLVDIRGTMPDPAASTPPFAGGGVPRGPGASVVAPRIDYETPEGWKPGSVFGSRAAAFVVPDAESAGEVLVLEFGGGNPSIVSSIVNLWRAEVRLPEVEELDDVAKPITVDGMPGQLVEFSAKGDDPARPSIVGAVLVGPKSTWVVKFSGPARLTTAEREHFDAFLNSLKVRTEE